MDVKQGIKTGGTFAAGIIGIILLFFIWLVAAIIAGIICSIFVGYPWGMIIGGIIATLIMYGLFTQKK